MISDSETKENFLKDLSNMEETLDDYLEFASSENNQQQNQLTNIGNFLESVFVHYKSKFKKFDSNLQNGIYSSIKLNQFRRAITNLLENSAKYSSEIKVTLKESSKFITIEIHDNGPGISAKERENVFKPFYRIDSSRNKRTGGVGLGMSIAKDIISKHGGSLKLGNSYLGGLLVTIRFPS